MVQWHLKLVIINCTLLSTIRAIISTSYFYEYGP